MKSIYLASHSLKDTGWTWQWIWAQIEEDRNWPDVCLWDYDKVRGNCQHKFS